MADGLDPRVVTMIVLGGAASFLVGNAFQAQMPRYAHDLGADGTGLRYSVLLAANAAGAVLGAALLETVNGLRPSARTAIVCAGLWGLTIGLFPAVADYRLATLLLVVAGVFDITFTSMAQTLVQTLAPSHQRGRIVGLFPAVADYRLATLLLVVAGVFDITFTSMAQTLVQTLAPSHRRGRIVGLFNTAVLGLRAGGGVTVGLLGAVTGVHWSLTLSGAAMVAVAAGLLARETRITRRASAGRR
jgi:sugar phosphate permease